MLSSVVVVWSGCDLMSNGSFRFKPPTWHLIRLCRKVVFWRQNPKVGFWKINDLWASTFLFSVICDRADQDRGLQQHDRAESVVA
jgi:hypothetical protein